MVVTIRDVAKRAGVSITTVSHVINESRFVSAETTQRVLQAMEELHYQPNALARSLRSKHSHTLGLVLPDASNPFFAEVARSIEDYAFDHGYNVLFGSSDGDLERERAYLRVFLEKQVDGLIFVAAGESTEHIRELQAEHLPLVVQRRPGRLTLSLQIDLAAILPPDRPWEAAVSAVLQHTDGRFTFWALSHPAPQPDFHHRAGFLLAV